MKIKNLSRKKITYILYATNAVITMIMGALYLFSPKFMPYHAKALSTTWADLAQEYQVLIKALMLVAGGGWFAVGAIVIILLLFPFRQNQKWSAYAIPAIFILFYVPTLLATLYVLQNTPASPPWYGNLISIVVSLLGLMAYPPAAMDQG